MNTILKKKNVVNSDLGQKMKKTKNILNLTKERLRSYPQLKRNLERYKLDIESIKDEVFGRSKSIVIFQPSYSAPLTVEDKRAAEIALIEKRMERDQREMKYIELALDGVRNDDYYPAFDLYIFKYMTTEEVGNKINSSQSSVSRNVKRLLNQVAVFFYGAETFAGVNA